MALLDTWSPRAVVGAAFASGFVLSTGWTYTPASAFLADGLNSLWYGYALIWLAIAIAGATLARSWAVRAWVAGGALIGTLSVTVGFTVLLFSSGAVA